MKQHALTHKGKDDTSSVTSRETNSENISITNDSNDSTSRQSDFTTKDRDDDSDSKSIEVGLKRSPPESAEVPVSKKPFGKD